MLKHSQRRQTRICSGQDSTPHHLRALASRLPAGCESTTARAFQRWDFPPGNLQERRTTLLINPLREDTDPATARLKRASICMQLQQSRAAAAGQGCASMTQGDCSACHVLPLVAPPGSVPCSFPMPPGTAAPTTAPLSVKKTSWHCKSTPTPATSPGPKVRPIGCPSHCHRPSCGPGNRRPSAAW